MKHINISSVIESGGIIYQNTKHRHPIMFFTPDVIDWLC
jgi:hypothetical protein